MATIELFLAVLILYFMTGGTNACFGVEVKCKTFGEYMEMIDKIAGSCNGMERGE